MVEYAYVVDHHYKFSITIRRYNVVKRTLKTVTIIDNGKEKRLPLEHHTYATFFTQEEAEEYRIKMINRTIDSTKSDLKDLEKQLTDKVEVRDYSLTLDERLGKYSLKASDL